MIAGLSRSVLDGRKRPQVFERRLRRDYAFVFSSSCDNRPSCLSIASRNLCKVLVAVHIDCLAYGGRCDLPVKRGSHPNAAISDLIKQASGRIAAVSARYFITVCGVGLGERDRAVNAGRAGNEVVVALLWQFGRECRKRRSNDE